jgi:Putative peptidoglycan binding domain
MATTLLPDQLTHATPAQMFDALGRAWQGRFGAAAARGSLLVLLAQWALETGRGASMHCWNVGNIKGKPDGSDGHDWTFFACDEVIGGKVVWFYPDNPGCCFRAYPTLDDGVVDYLGTVSTRFASAWPAVIAGDPAQFAHLLKVAGYYTASEAQYTASVQSLFNEFNGTIGAAPAPTAGPAAAPAGGSLDLYTVQGQQTALNLLGANPQLNVDGQAGAATAAAVKAFQRDHGLVADGIAGPQTIAALGAALAAQGTSA